MPLITESLEKAFDMDTVHKGDLIRARYHTWPEPRNGIVAAVTRQSLSVLYLPGLGNVSNYFCIPVAEVAAGKWGILWSGDLETVQKEGLYEAGGADPQPPDGGGAGVGGL